MFAIQRRYLALVQRARLSAAAATTWTSCRWSRRSRRPSRSTSQATVPCHNDLLAATSIDDGTRIWFIDYEYAGNNDPCFELGNIWSEASLPTRPPGRHSSRLIYGSPVAVARSARARLLGLMSKYGWTLWASIQDAISDVDFDFWSWGMEKYDRAMAEFRRARPGPSD